MKLNQNGKAYLNLAQMPVYCEHVLLLFLCMSKFRAGFPRVQHARAQLRTDRSCQAQDITSL